MHNWLTRLFAGVIVMLTLAALWVSWRSPLARAIRNQYPVFALVIGTDWVDHSRHADTIILLRYDPAARSLDLLSVPRDTRINLPELKVRRVNEVYAYTFLAKKNHDLACRETARAVAHLLFSRVLSTSDPVVSAAPEINFYAQFDYAGFKKMIDILGGVEVKIDQPMHYDDQWGKLHIHFDSGKFLLDGQKALEYIRFRGSGGDYERTVRQQEFFLKAINRLKNPLLLTKLPQMVWASLSSVKSNLNWLEQLTVLWEMKDLRKDRIQLLQLPGRSVKQGFWIPDEDGLNATAYFLATGKRFEQESSSGAAAAPRALTVEVWNGSSKTGLAKEVMRKLRKAGFDVVKYGDYPKQAKTVVRDYRGSAAQARAIVRELSVSGVEVFTHLESNPLVDVKVILGEDYGVKK